MSSIFNSVPPSTEEYNNRAALKAFTGIKEETDPFGKNQHEKGSKLDHGKTRFGLVLGGFSNAIEAVAEVGTYGANKYTDNGWLEVPNGVERYTDAMYRHLFKESQGEHLDKDTELLHAAHAAWNALARLELLILKARHVESALDLIS